MSTLVPAPRTRKAEIFYPDSDGEPMADNTVQFRWIVTIQGGLDSLFADNPDVFVAGDLLWYPVEGKPKICAAPDAMVALGRPKGDRGSYKQWEEGGVAPQVVFEVLSPTNHLPEMLRKFGFYDRYGVEEYYVYDPDAMEFYVALRDENGVLTPTDFGGEFISPHLGVRFSLPDDADSLAIYHPNGERFRSYVELAAERDAVTAERDAVTAERDAERARAQRLAARLRELGVEPD